METPQTSSPSESLQSLPVSIASEAEHEIKNEKFKISLDSPNNTYYSGQTIRGTIELTNKQAKKIRGESCSMRNLFLKSKVCCLIGAWQLLCIWHFTQRRRIQSNQLLRISVGIYFRVVGYGKCSWTDILRRDSITDGNKSERTPIQQHSGNEKYLNSTVYVIGAKNGEF